ncbi:hypothetical protein JL721_9589 [Aureococcus anophagefferens]|nr:hypothetical protein JL721_9589 [Aureococcus anophagefferens]
MSTRRLRAQTLCVSASRIFLADFDTAVTSAASDAFGEAGPLILADDLARKRLRMPIRHGGGAAPRVGAAAAGAGCAVLPTMVDRLVGGLTVAGFMTQLEPELGQGSFDEGASGQFAGLEAAAGSGCSTAVEMLAAWDSMVAAVAEEEDHEGLLAKPFADAGVGDGGVRAARAWLTTLPVGCAAFTNGEFAEVAATYFGVKSPCMIPTILNRKSVRTAWHDSVATVIEGSLREARVSYDREVLGVFADLVPADAATSFFEQHAGKGARDKAGIVPDFKLVPGGRAAQLADVKTIGFAKSRYGRSPARRGGTLPCDERAGIINREYRLHAEKLDKKFYPDEASPGPFERRLGSFGSVVGFVAGYFGELSKGAHEVLAMAAEIAERTWVEAGATSLDHAKSIQKQRLYREWGVASVRAVARIKSARPHRRPVAGVQKREAPDREGRRGEERGDDDAEAKHDSPARKRSISGSGDDAA